LKADPGFAARLKALLEKYEQAAQEHAAATGTTYQATLIGSGAIAQGEGAVAAGERGVAVGGSVQGGVIITGDGNVVGDHSRSNVRINRREKDE